MNPSFPLWRLDLLGELRLVRLGEPDLAPVVRFRSRKTAALLAFLALRRGAHRREALAEAFWPEAPIGAARNSLRVALSSLRALLEPPGVAPGTVLLVSPGGVALSAALICDVKSFENALFAARGAESTIERRAELERALEWYRGPLADLDDAPGLAGEESRLEDDFVSATGELVALCEATGELRPALHLARSALERAPGREEIALDVLRLSIALGEREAGRDFKKWCARAQKQGVLLAPETLDRALAWQNGRGAQARRETGSGVRLCALPTNWSAFFGRESEIARVQSDLKGGARLLTLTGSGGVGKTRLALQLARRLATQKTPDFGLIVWLSLADLPVASLVPAALSTALGATRSAGRAPLPTAALRGAKPGAGGRILLFLDGFEHLCDDGGPLVREWIGALPELTCLLLSRRALGFVGEIRREIMPLPCESNGETDEESPALKLFFDRARLARPGWEVDAEQRAAMKRICAHFEGLPLALEIAASRLALFSPAQILAEIESQSPDEIDLSGALGWKNPDRAASPRHASLRTAIAWSERQLPIGAAHFWAQIAVFRGGFSLEAASHVLDCDAAPLVMALEQVSLLRLDTSGEIVRALQLESVRHYATSLLDDAARADLAARHARYFREWSESQPPHSSHLETERLNLEFARRWFARAGKSSLSA